MENERRRLLTVAQAAAVLGISGNTLRNWADKGLIAHEKTPTGYRRFDPDVVEAFRAAMAEAGDPATQSRRPGRT